MWTGSDDALTRVLESMDAQTFEDAARENADRMPPALKPKAIAAMRKFVESTTDHLERQRTALNLIELAELDLDGIVKDILSALPGGDIRNLSSHYALPALEYLHNTDPAWTSEWVVVQIADSVLYSHEEWLPFATVIPDHLIETYLHRLGTENLENSRFEGMIAARVFAKLRELRRTLDAEPGQRHELEWQVMRQLEAVFRRIPDDEVAAAILSSVMTGDPLDIRVTANLLSRVARSDVEPMRVADDLRKRLRAYLKSSVNLVLRQDDFNGEEKANLPSSIARVGEPEDMADLVALISADIERVRRGRAARAASDRGPLGNGVRLRAKTGAFLRSAVPV